MFCFFSWVTYHTFISSYGSRIQKPLIPTQLPLICFHMNRNAPFGGCNFYWTFKNIWEYQMHSRKTSFFYSILILKSSSRYLQPACYRKEALLNARYQRIMEKCETDSTRDSCLFFRALNLFMISIFRLLLEMCVFDHKPAMLWIKLLFAWFINQFFMDLNEREKFWMVFGLCRFHFFF